MGTTKLTATWRIVKSRKTLKGRMELLIFLQRYTEHVSQALDAYATERGELETLLALRALKNEKLDK